MTATATETTTALFYPKFFVKQLETATPVAEQRGTFDCAGVRGFQRVWVQGISLGPRTEGPGWLLDDGTGVAHVIDTQVSVPAGGYAMVLGRFVIVEGCVCLKRHKIVDLSAQPNRESLWTLEVVECQLSSR